ncbi:MAG: methyltransferase domain-containing protein [Akkermansiaceae bacterium]
MTDWNQRYQTKDTPWDKGEAAPPLLEIFVKHEPSLWGNGEILVPGCGAGHDVRALSSQGLKPLGLDLAPLALEIARNQQAAGQETYELGDFLDSEWRQGRSFSAIWEHTCFCAIHPSQRPKYALACSELIPENGHLIGVFFLTPNGPDELDDGPPFNSSIAEIDDHFSTWFERIDSWLPTNCYPGREGKEWIAIYRRKSDKPQDTDQ